MMSKARRRHKEAPATSCGPGETEQYDGLEQVRRILEEGLLHMPSVINVMDIFYSTRTFGWPTAILVLAPAEGWKGPSGPAGNLCPLSSVLCPLSSVSALHYHLVQYIVLLYSDPTI